MLNCSINIRLKMVFSKGLQPKTIIRLSEAVEQLKNIDVAKMCQKNSIDNIIEKMGLKGVVTKKKQQLVAILRKVIKDVKEKYSNSEVTTEKIALQLNLLAEEKQEKEDAKAKLAKEKKKPKLTGRVS